MNARKLILTALTILGVTSGGLLLSSDPAGAVLVHPLLEEFGSLELGAGVAIDPSNDNVYAVDGGSAPGVTGTVYVFNSKGAPPVDDVPGTLTGALTPQGEFELDGRSVGIAVDGSGDVYVSDTGHNVVDKFRVNAKHEFEYVCQFVGFTEKGGASCVVKEGVPPEIGLSEPTGIAIDQQGDIYLASEEDNAIYEYSPTGEGIRRIQGALLQHPQFLAVDSKGDIYVKAGAEVGEASIVDLKRGSLTGEVESEARIVEHAEGVAFDRATGRLYVLYGSSVTEYNEQAEIQTEFGAGLLGKGVRPVAGLAVNEATDVAYVANDSVRNVTAFGPSVLLPSVTTEGSSNVQALDATVSGAINPENNTLGATCHVEYGMSARYGSKVPCSVENLGTGNSEVPVSVSLTGLEGHTTYHYRVAATNSNGTNYGADKTFTTPPEKPILIDLSAFVTSPGEALVRAIINPENEETTYHFVYGPTALYGFMAPARESDLGGGPRALEVSLSLAELKPATTYHYAVVATNATGTRNGPDETFTTAPAVLPAVETLEADEVTQDTATILGSVDSRGVQSMYEFDIGTDTSYGARVFGDAGSAPGAQTHTLSLVGLAPGMIYHYRLVASNAYGVSYGADRTFTTPGFPMALIASPGTVPLVASPAFQVPSTVDATTPKAAQNKRKARRKKRQTKRRRRPARERKGRKAGGRATVSRLARSGADRGGSR